MLLGKDIAFGMHGGKLLLLKKEILQPSKEILNKKHATFFEFSKYLYLNLHL